ncbi:monovalent cation/H+ antiporter complex subunit F [Chthonobacter rhizosphaerae]|uniref:monovalent cation/H+ antiporter complex subunit F n=1 Tax=Chthonobacter rhizosphaerae TaxID=2735553 RepID=UPI0015EEAC4C|nr:monovalent cation/H+ antiporter complex subunit F [Chthonobacter rhizosphaerae]
MSDAFTLAATALLLTVATALLRCWKGPGRVDRIMAAQLAGTGMVGITVALGAARRDPAMLDAALTASLLAAVLVSAFVRANPFAGRRPERTGNPESAERSL